MTPTSQQQAFLTALKTTTANLALVARAGCGKTSTILLGVDALVAQNPNLEVLVCAYNKAIAVEVGEKLKKAGHTNWKQVQSTTLHALGFGLVRFVFKAKIQGDPGAPKDKVRALIEERNDPICHAYGEQVEKLVRYAKQAGVGFFNDLPIGDVSVWHQLADHFDVNGLDDTSEADLVVEAAQAIYRASLAQTDVIDFDDMILFPLIKNIRVKFGKDVIFLDEAQDLSRARQALARKLLKPHVGRMIVVGDDRQAIYGFTGADASALDNLKRDLQAVELPLSVTWRCPKAVVRLAQRLVPDIEAAPSAPEGAVKYMSALPGDIGPTDAILCRNTAPLIGIAYGLIRKGTPCKVEGRAIGDGLIALVKRWKIVAIDKFLDRLDDYRAKEIQKAMAKGRGYEAKVEEIEDRCETLKQICESCLLKDQHRTADVVDAINNLFQDGVKDVTTLCTMHRSKGREWDRVFIWEYATRCPSKAAKQEWQLVQENNIQYVALTRAKQTLVFVDP